MGGEITDVVDVYRRYGVRSTVARGASQLETGIRRNATCLYWRLTNTATIPLSRGTIQLHAGAPAEREAIWYLAEYEDEEVERIVDTLEETDVFYDVGANVGYYTCAVARLTDASVHAFEPHPRNLDRISENLDLNDAPGETHEMALGATSDTVEFATDAATEPGFSHGAITRDRTPVDTSEEILVEQRPVDDVVAEGIAPPPTVVKIDVEGAEGRVLEGMRSQLESGSIRSIHLELHEPAPHRLSVEDFGDSPAGILSLLEDSGLRVVTDEQRRAERHVVAIR